MMSCYEWEAGTIKLPTAVYATVKNTVRAAMERHAAALFDASQEFWKGLPAKYRKDKGLCSQAVMKFVNGNSQNDSWNKTDPRGDK